MTKNYFENPKIVIISPEDSDVCEWLSVGWYTHKNRHLSESKELFSKAEAAMGKADDIPEAKKLLEEAGFTVEINPDMGSASLFNTDF